MKKKSKRDCVNSYYLSRIFRIMKFTTILLLMVNVSMFANNSRENSELKTNKSEGVSQLSVSGKVVDVSGIPVSGASVQIKGTSIGTQTDFDGKYTIDASGESAVLIFSYLGYKTQELTIGTQTVIDVVMTEDTAQLEQVVVIGYGTKRREDLTGAIASIGAEEIAKRGVTNVSEALRGRVPGLNATVSNSPSGGTNFLVRGATSLSGGTAPLIVLDGVIFYGSLADINANDVQSIDVLRDASSAAIFGARSSNGVIIITTKKGKGKPVININSSIGITKLTNNPDFRGPQQYLDFKVGAYEMNNPGTSGPNPQYYRNPAELDGVDLNTWRNYVTPGGSRTDNEIWFNRLSMSSIELENFEAGRTIDWYDEIIQDGLRRENSISISNGDDKSSQYFSLSQVDNDGFIVGQNFKTTRARLNLETTLKSYIKIGANAQFSRDNAFNGNDGENTNLGTLSPSFSRALSNSPYGSKYDDNGTLKLEPFGDAAAENPFFVSDNSTRNIADDNLIANIFAEIELPYGFKYRVNWVNSFNWNEFSSFNRTTEERQGSGGTRSASRSYTWNIDNIISWERQFGEDHKVDATFLINAEKRKNSGVRANNSQFVPNELLEVNNLEIGTNPSLATSASAYSADGLMARVNYGYKGKYLLTGSIRRDGYSVFGENNRRANFLAGALAWNISQEDFLQDVDWLDYLKLRLSWGENGNRSGLALYSSLPLLGIVDYIYSDNGTDIPVTGLTKSRLGDSNLKWESTESLNIGTDFSVFGGRLTGSFEYYRATTTDLLVDRALPILTGFNVIRTNLGRLDNTGFEATLNANIIEKPNFNWNAGLVYSTNKNEIKELYGDVEDVLDGNGNVVGRRLADDRANNRFIGQSIDAIYGFEIDGVYTTDEAAEAAIYNREPGDFRVVDQNGDGVIEANVDEKFLGQSTPKHNFNLTNNFTFYKNFTLSISLDGKLGHKGIYNGRFGGGLEPDASWQAQRLNGYQFPFWTPDNQLNDWARLGSRANGEQYYDSRSFVRIQNITLGYNFPKSITDALKIEGLKFSLDLNNVDIFSNWEFYDPETYRSSGYSQPGPRPVPFIGTARILITL
jgi:TonB-linked SusC/RagA family outer membrane protein